MLIRSGRMLIVMSYLGEEGSGCEFCPVSYSGRVELR